VFTKISLLLHYWNRKRLFERKYRKAAPYVTRDSSFEQEKYSRQLDLVKDRRYLNAIEVGCGEGVFLEKLAPFCDFALGVDLSEEAIHRARKYCEKFPQVQFKVENLTAIKSDQVFDLVVATDVLYYMGQEHDWAHMQTVMDNLCRVVTPGGRLLLTNCHTGMSHNKDWLSLQVMRRYREECVRQGFVLTVEKEYEGFNGSHQVPYLISLMEKSE